MMPKRRSFLAICLATASIVASKSSWLVSMNIHFRNTACGARAGKSALIASWCSKPVHTSTPCHFQRPVFVGSTSTSIWRSWRYAASPPNIRLVKNDGRPANASRIHSWSNVFSRAAAIRSVQPGDDQQDQLQQNQDHHGHLEQFAPRHRRVLHGKAVDVVECLQLFAHVTAPLLEAEAGGGHREQPRHVDVAGNLQRVFRPVGELVDVDEQRMHVPGGARVAASRPVLPPAALLQLAVDAGELAVEQPIVVAELE